MKLAELAARTNAQLEQGEPDFEITGAAGLDDAAPGCVTFLANPRYTARVETTQASAIFVGTDAVVRKGIAVLRAADPYLAYTRALRLFHPEPHIAPGIHPSAAIDPTARIADDVFIGAHVAIGVDVVIEQGARIHPNVTIYDRVRIGADSTIHSGTAVREDSIIGARVTIHNNVTIGADGFGYAKDEEKRWLKIPQTGRVRIQDDVEIGANTAIDCASVGETIIRRGAKIDNLVQIGHSCTIGEDALICAQTGLAGSSHIGARVILAGQVGIAGHLHVGDDAVLTAGSATSHDVPPGKVLSGKPAFDNKEWLRSTAAFRRLGEQARINRELTARLAKLETQLAARDEAS